MFGFVDSYHLSLVVCFYLCVNLIFLFYFSFMFIFCSQY